VSDITPSDTQYRAIAAIQDWFENDAEQQQVYRMFGFAGTGKSTVLRFALEALGLEHQRIDDDSESCVPGVVTATFTGKAALVLRRKGTPARTIHSLIYSVDVTPDQALRGGQVICGMNATRLQLNNAMRRAAGFGADGWLPTSPGEKIICLKNQNDLGLINGMFLTLSDIVDEGSHYLSAVVTDEDGNRIGAPQADGSRGRLRVYKGHFEDHVAFDKQRHDRDWKLKKGLTEATFGWAITAHKAQGSQWENVIVWDDGLGRSEIDRRRWLYTAITRAERGLVLLA